MKKSLVFFLFLVTGFSLFAKEDWDYKNYFQNDSAQIFSWDATLNDWVLNSTQVFYYNSNEKLISVVERSHITELFISKIDYSYYENGFVSTQEYYSWNSLWIPTSRYEITYDENNKTSGILLRVFKEGIWINNRWSTNYKYDEEGRLTEFQSSAWNIQGNDWFPPRTDYSTYDDEGRLISVCLLTQIVNKYWGLPEYIKKVPGILESKIMNP